MADVSKFNVLGQSIDVKDAIAREQSTNAVNVANGASQTASSASANASEALEKANEALAGIEAHRYVLIGDSYGEGYTPDGNVKSWMRWVQELVKGVFYSSAVGGSGFGGDNTFLTQLQNIDAGDRTAITDVIIAGGYNDNGRTGTFLSVPFASTVDYVKAQFPNARIMVLSIGWGKRVSERTNIYNNVIAGYRENALVNGIEFNNLSYILHDYSFFSSDGFHPNANGQRALGVSISALLKGNKIPSVFSWRVLTTTWDGTVLGTPEIGEVFGISMEDGMFNIDCNFVQFSVPIKTISGGSYIKVGTFNSDIFEGYNTTTPYCSIDVNGWAQNTLNAYYNINCKFVFNQEDHGIYLYITNVQPDASGYFVLENCKAIRLQAGHAVIPSFLC